MNVITFQPDEVAQEIITQQKLQSAQRALHDEGFVILDGIVDQRHAAALYARMLDDTDVILSRRDVPYNFNSGNIQQDPPPFHPFLFRDVVFNEIVIAITRSVLGDGVKNSFYSGNTALPMRGVRQPVHADMGQLWPNLQVATPPYGLVVNVLPVDVSPHNGSTEIWPGTHNDTSVYVQRGDIKVPPERVEARRAICPPVQPSARAGSVLIRDLRLWHAGMPNNSDKPRPMIAMIHWVSWWNDSQRMQFPRGTEDFFSHLHLTSLVDFVDGPVDYLARHTSYDYQQ